MFSTVLGVILLLCIIGSVVAAFAVVKRNGSMLDKVYARLVDTCACFIIGTVVVATVAAFVLILGG